MHLYAAQRDHKCHKCAVAPHEIENKCVFKCALKTANDRAVSRRLKGSSFHARGSVATRLGCGGVFVYDFVTNFLLSLTVKEF